MNIKFEGIEVPSAIKPGDEVQIPCAAETRVLPLLSRFDASGTTSRLVRAFVWVVCLSVCLSVCLPVYLSVCLPACLPSLSRGHNSVDQGCD
eukprot:109886-Rhodomonas_salina.4